MADNDESGAWLDIQDGQRLRLDATFSIGRLDANDLAISGDEVSRRHAIVQRQDADEYWLIDLASRNGTNLNQQRLALPTRLHDGDVIEVGEVAIIFRQRAHVAGPTVSSPAPPETSVSITTAQRWLLVVDIMGSTALAASMSEMDMAATTGKWIISCSDVIKNSGGAVNKYLGDGFLAYWRDDEKSVSNIRAAINALAKLQRDPNVLRFRVVLHFGQVALGGHAAMAEESLTGLNVSFAFRMEGLASKLGQQFLISEAARDRLGSEPAFVDLGLHQLPNSGRTEGIRIFTLA